MASANKPTTLIFPDALPELQVPHAPQAPINLPFGIGGFIAMHPPINKADVLDQQELFINKGFVDIDVSKAAPLPNVVLGDDQEIIVGLAADVNEDA